MLNWLKALFFTRIDDPSRAEPRSSPVGRHPSGHYETVRVGDVARSPGVDVRPFDDADFEPEYRRHLEEALAVDPNVMRVWAVVVESPEQGVEIWLRVELASADPHSLQGIVDRVNAIGGPSCAVGVASGDAEADPIYEKSRV